MGETENIEGCLSCGWKELNPYIKSNGYQIVKCNQCGLLFVNPRPTEDSIKQMFVEEYIGTDERVTEDFTSWRLASLKREANYVKKLLPEGGRLLDLGTASGAFLGEFSNSPEWQAEGVEPSQFAAKVATERYQVPVHHGFLRDLSLPTGSFDVVTSLDAFCFHPNPNPDLQEIARILRPGGFLAIELPGLRFRLLKNTGLLCRLIYGVQARLNAGVHLVYYNRRTLGRMVGRYGFDEIMALPESSPSYGPVYFRLMTRIYYIMTRFLYGLTGGAAWVPVPKEFFVYKKVEK